MEHGVENGESSGGEGGKIQRRLFNSRDKFVYERTESDMDENDAEGMEGMEEGRVGLLGRMLGKKKKKKKKKESVIDMYLKGKRFIGKPDTRIYGKDSSGGGNSPSNGGRIYGGSKYSSKKEKKCKKKKSSENGVSETGVCTTTCRCGDVNNIDDDVFDALGNINKMRKIEAKDLFKKRR